MSQRVLLLNPPGKFNYGRDYYCSKVNKADYVEHPVDFLYLTGVLHDAGIEYSVIDAIVSPLSQDDVFQKIKEFQPTHIFFLSGWVSWVEDFAFLKSVRNSFENLKLIGLGDIFLDKEVFKREKWIDAVLYDFTNGDILKYLEGDYGSTKNMLIRDDESVIFKKLKKNEDTKPYRLPLPRYEHFIDQPYTFPFARHPKYVTVLTDFGCPFRCSFCVYSEIGYKLQELDRVFSELEEISKLGFKELFIKDQTFCINRERGEKLCQFMIENNMNFSWTCFLRVTQADLEFLKLMKKAGCHTIIFGVETGSQEQLDEYLKGTSIADIQTAIRNCKKAGIQSVCTFILGFPEESEKSIENTINFSLELNPTYAAFNTYVKKTTSLGFDSDPIGNHDQSGISDQKLEGNGVLSGEQILRLRKRAVRQFYLRPQYLLSQMARNRTFSELKNKIRSFQFLLKNA